MLLLLILCVYVNLDIFIDLSLADLLHASSWSWPALCSGTAPVDRKEGPGSISGCPNGPVYGQWAPPAGGSEPGQHTQSLPPRYIQDHLTAGITYRWREKNPHFSLWEWIELIKWSRVCKCYTVISNIPVATEQQPQDGQTNWPQTWWGALWDSERCGAWCPPEAANPHCSNDSPPHCSSDTQSWTHTATHEQDHHQPLLRSGWQREACVSCSNCCETIKEVH